MFALDGRPTNVTWNYDRAELIADSVIHVLGSSLGLSGVIALVIFAASSAQTDKPAVLIYAGGLLAMLSFSATYNMWRISRVKWMLRRFDHAAIFVMIAGTYAPFVARMKFGLVSMGLFIGIWLTACIGVALKLLLPGRCDRLAVALYLLFGWCGVVVCGPVAAVVPSLSMWLLAAGGALYSAGVVFHGWQSLHFQNAIWLGFVLIAACCHYSAVLYCVANA